MHHVSAGSDTLGPDSTTASNCVRHLRHRRGWARGCEEPWDACVVITSLGPSDVFGCSCQGGRRTPFGPAAGSSGQLSCISRPAPGSCQSTKIVSHRRTAATTPAWHSRPHHAPNLRGNERRRETKNTARRRRLQTHPAQKHDITAPPRWSERANMSATLRSLVGRAANSFPLGGPTYRASEAENRAGVASPPRLPEFSKPCCPRIGSDGH